MLEREMKRLIEDAISSRTMWGKKYREETDREERIEIARIIMEWDVRVKAYQQAYGVYSNNCPRTERFTNDI